MDSIPRSGRCLEGGHDYPLQHSCLENHMDGGGWQATVHGVTELDMTEVTQHTCMHGRFKKITFPTQRGFLGGSDGKESTCNVGDPGLTSGSGKSPGEEMATHSSILAWKIPWMEEPGRLQSMGSQRVRHN